MLNELVEGLCVSENEKDLDVCVEAMAVDFNEGKAELIEMSEVSVKRKQRKLWVYKQLNQIPFFFFGGGGGRDVLIEAADTF